MFSWWAHWCGPWVVILWLLSVTTQECMLVPMWSSHERKPHHIISQLCLHFHFSIDEPHESLAFIPWLQFSCALAPMCQTHSYLLKSHARIVPSLWTPVHLSLKAESCYILSPNCFLHFLFLWLVSSSKNLRFILVSSFSKLTNPTDFFS